MASPHQPSSLLPKSWRRFRYARSPSAPRVTHHRLPWWNWHVSWCGPPRHMGSGCSKCVQQGWCICKTGAGFPRRKGSAAFRHALTFWIPVGGVCSDLCFSDSLLLFSAVTKVYISSFSYLCRRPNLQNGFPVLLVFFENESIKRLIASVYTEEPASCG